MKLTVFTTFLKFQDHAKYWACSQRKDSCSESCFGTWFGLFPDLKAWFCPLWTQSSFKSGFWNAKRRAFWIVIHVESLILRTWMQSSFGTWFMRAHFGNARWSHAWVNHRGLRSRNKILPRSAQILFVIGTTFGMLVNAHSSNHEPNQEADRNPKWLSERDSFLCEQAHYLLGMFCSGVKLFLMYLTQLCDDAMYYLLGILNCLLSINMKLTLFTSNSKHCYKQKAVSNQAFENAFWNAKKRAFWIVIRLESLILVHVNAKLFRNVIRACAFKNACWRIRKFTIIMECHVSLNHVELGNWCTE